MNDCFLQELDKILEKDLPKAIKIVKLESTYLILARSKSPLQIPN